ncbi:MAG TPA: DUF2007 domain-containing protein [Candidatus Acidoferrales bacterium]|nr:DUF2007 domain-containing protein [Candidatus Acidoferrales bacterium]
MDEREGLVRIWMGLNSLQAEFMRQLLVDHNIECFSALDTGMLYAGARYETSIWVTKENEERARGILGEAEESMSEQLNAESSDDGTANDG